MKSDMEIATVSAKKRLGMDVNTNILVYVWPQI